MTRLKYIQGGAEALFFLTDFVGKCAAPDAERAWPKMVLTV